MVIARKHRRQVHGYRIMSNVERYVRRLANRRALLAVALLLVLVALFFVALLARVIITIAVRTVTVIARLAIAMMLSVCRNLFRTFPA